MPNCLASLVKMCASSALRSSALDGMQPTLRLTRSQKYRPCNTAAPAVAASGADMTATASADSNGLASTIAMSRLQTVQTTTKTSSTKTAGVLSTEWNHQW